MIQEAEYMSKQPFGKNEQGSDVFLYTLENDQIQASFSDYGATMVSLIYKKTGVDVLLGYDSVEGYIQNSGHLGGLPAVEQNRAPRRFRMRLLHSVDAKPLKPVQAFIVGSISVLHCDLCMQEPFGRLLAYVADNLYVCGKGGVFYEKPPLLDHHA